MSKPTLLHSFIGEYQLVDFLGAGGMGEVYRGVHARLGRVVAIKVLTESAFNPGFNERFINEARIQACLRHQNIVTLYDFIEANNQPCIIMEYIDGETLLERIKACGVMPLPEAVSIFRAVVEAVAYIHSQGIIHRDIKSNNIKIGSTGEVKVLDFGIAKAGTSPGLTAVGNVVGTLQYLSPEQLLGQAADARSDIWALGTLLYEMVTGTAPFAAPTIGELFTQISKAAYVPPSALNRDVPREMEAIISRCLKKRAADRYQSAEELLRDIRQINFRDIREVIYAHPQTKQTSSLLDAITGNRRLSAGLAAVVLLVLVVLYMATRPPEPAPPKPPVNKNSKLPAAAQPPTKSFQIDASDGRSEVFINGQRIGTTPCQFDARIGEQLELLLKRDGYVDRREQFTVTENKKVYTFSMNRQQ